MYDYQMFKLVHLHDGERFPMEERHPEDSAEHDPERGWVDGSKIFRCSRCAEEVVVLPPGHDRSESEPR